MPGSAELLLHHTRESLSGMKVAQLKRLLDERGLDYGKCLEKTEFVDLLVPYLAKTTRSEVIPDVADETSPSSSKGHTSNVKDATPLEQPQHGKHDLPHLEQPQYMDQADWQAQLDHCHELERTHAQQGIRYRRMHSWARLLAHAKVVLGHAGQKIRKGTPNLPFVIWVLGAEDQVEGFLAEQGLFNDTNWVDGVPTEIYLWGDCLRDVDPFAERMLQGDSPNVRTVSYKDVQTVQQVHPPDLVALFMPTFGFQGGDAKWIPEDVLSDVANVPVVVSLRFNSSGAISQNLQRKLKSSLILSPRRCPFSASAGDEGSDFDDNGWFFAVRAEDVSCITLALEVVGASCDSANHHEEGKKIPALFWGIVDIKYDSRLQFIKRVKVLEIGDGRISKFSDDGARIPEAFHQGFEFIEGSALQKYTVVSTDKKLTHDLMVQAGYGHIIPKQVCMPRMAKSGLAQQIMTGLDLDEGDEKKLVVLKLCNRSRGAGVIVTPVDDFERVLRELLVLPANLTRWFDAQASRLVSVGAADLGFEKSSFEEQQRHWWGNEAPCFVVEQYSTSVPTQQDGKMYDATMRVSFALSFRHAGGDTEQLHEMPLPNDLKVHWLGGYWKLPAGDLSSEDLRSKCVSAARTSGTLPVSIAILHEVYSALGDSMQQLLGGPAPSPQDLKEIYAQQPELAAFLIARLGLAAHMPRDQVQFSLHEAEQVNKAAADSPSKKCVESFIARCWGICEIKPRGGQANPKHWDLAHPHFDYSVLMQPVNANALFWFGMSLLVSGKLDKAIEFMNKSLILDPDFKGPYVNLGVAYLRNKQYKEAIDVSRAGLARFPDSPQCRYQIAAASYLLAIKYYNEPEAIPAETTSHEETSPMDLSRFELVGAPYGIEGPKPSRRDRLTSAAQNKIRFLFASAFEEMWEAREHPEGQKRKARVTPISPWLEQDDKILSRSRCDMDIIADKESFVMPQTAGWRFFNYRV